MSRREDRESTANGPLVTYRGTARRDVWWDMPGQQAWRRYEKASARAAIRAISRIIRREERRQRRCWRHEDCREDHGVGAACYALRRGWPWAASAVCQGECCVGPVDPWPRLEWEGVDQWGQRRTVSFRLDLSSWHVSDGDYSFRDAAAAGPQPWPRWELPSDNDGPVPTPVIMSPSEYERLADYVRRNGGG